MKKYLIFLLLPLVLLSAFLMTRNAFNKKNAEGSNSKPLSIAEKKVAKKNWEASSDGVKFKAWLGSEVGKKIHTNALKIQKTIDTKTSVVGIVSSLELPKGSRLGYGFMVKIDNEEYILAFGPKNPKGLDKKQTNEFEQLENLKVNDKIIINGRGVSFAPKYAYAILSSSAIEKDQKVLYKYVPAIGGC